MLNKLNFYTDQATCAIAQLPDIDFRIALNTPTGDFFYDEWVIRPEFVGTVWERIYNSLQVADKGEARIIKLVSGACYASHADVDDRYHLNLAGNNCYIVDLDNKEMSIVPNNGYWYEMDAGVKHTAMNVGNRTRYQVVIRKLFKKVQLANPMQVSIWSTIDPEDARFAFDDNISQWLNRATKAGHISNFKFEGHVVEFEIEYEQLTALNSIIPDELTLTSK